MAGDGPVAVDFVGIRTEGTGLALSPFSSVNCKGGSRSRGLSWQEHQWHHRNIGFWWTFPGEEYAEVHFLVVVLWFYPPHTTALSQIWGKQVLGETCHIGSPSPRQPHNCLISCNHSISVPSTSLALGLG